MNNIYCKSFIFQAERYEEYQDGKCINKDKIDTQVIAKIANSDYGYKVAVFNLRNNIPNINSNFGLPIFGVQAGDILEDRVQYGRIPDSMRWEDSNEPIVCNIFNNMQCIRFAMLSPLRIIEFYGKFSCIN